MLRCGRFGRNGRFLRALVGAEELEDATLEGGVKLWLMTVKTTMMRSLMSSEGRACSLRSKTLVNIFANFEI